MAQQTLKRRGSHGDDVVDDGFAGDDGHDDPLPEFSQTWGNERMPKKPRYVLDSSLNSNSDSSVDQHLDVSETVSSVQSKPTKPTYLNDGIRRILQSWPKNFPVGIPDSDSASTWSIDCVPPRLISSDYEARVSSPTVLGPSNITSSDSSIALEYETGKIHALYDKTVPSSDNGYGDSDIQATPKENAPTAWFKNCLLCRKINNNPAFQYCVTCFQFRKEYFIKRPNPRRKRIRSRFTNKMKDSQEYDLFGPILSQEEKVNSSEYEFQDTSLAKVDENSNNLCNICLILPKNGIFNHGKIGHVYCCYTCAKKLWKKCNRCPLCNAKIKFVTKMITG